MPVTVELMGDIQNEPGEFDCYINRGKDKGNINLLARPEWIDGIRHALRDIKCNLRVYLVPKHYDANFSFYWHVFSTDEFQERAPKGKLTDNILSDTDDSVTVILRNNMTDHRNYKPTTGWIVLHRLFHIIDLNDNMEKQYYTKSKTIIDFLNKLSTELYNVPFTMQDSYNVLKDKDGLVYKIFTMASARNQAIDAPSDLMAELGTQYALTGGITLNDLPETHHGITPDPKELTLWNKRLHIQKRKWERLFAQNLDDVVGKICIF